MQGFIVILKVSFVFSFVFIPSGWSLLDSFAFVSMKVVICGGDCNGAGL
jgi:hypothetical protein